MFTGIGLSNFALIQIGHGNMFLDQISPDIIPMHDSIGESGASKLR